MKKALIIFTIFLASTTCYAGNGFLNRWNKKIDDTQAGNQESNGGVTVYNINIGDDDDDVNNGATDTNGRYYAPSGNGVVDTVNGTYYERVGGGYVNTRTGEFVPAN